MKSILISLMLIAFTHAQLDMTSDKRIEYDDNIAEESQSSERHVFTDVIAPPSKPILNDGKPFYVARDPNTGTLDFNSKKTVGIQNDIPISRKDELASGGQSKGHDINSIGHTFHDYLNIPVKYSSSKFVYPLISSSYANLKYQGNNKNQLSNHKNYSSTLGTTTASPKYFTHIISSISATEVTTRRQPEITRRIFTTTTTSEKPTTTTTTTTQKSSTTTTTTEKPTTTTTSTTTTTTTTSTEAPSTVKYSSTIIQSNQFPSTFKKYVDSSETRKKFTTTSKPPITIKEDSETMPANPVKFLDDLLEAIDRKETTTLTMPTTHRPPFDRLSFATSMPLKPSAFKPMPTEGPNQSQKIVFESVPDKTAMSLSEIFNSIAGSDKNEVIYEAADSSHVEVKKPLPLSPLATTTTVIQTTTTQSPPPPQAATVQHKTLQQQMKDPNNGKPQYVDLPVHQAPAQSNFAQQHPPQYGSSHVGFPDDDQFDDYVEFENSDDQYVRYEVQKPNVNMVKFQQMPLPSMNNVVISPGQNSATFVLGSQQSVGSVGVGSSMGVGTSHFADKGSSSIGPVKMGQVINDEPPVRTNGNQIQASIRFPSDAESAFDNAPIIKGTFKLDGSAENVHPPQALSQNQPSSPVSQKPLVFPSNEANVIQAELSVGMPAPLPSTQPSNPSQIIFENVNDIYGKVKQKQDVKEIQSNELAPPSILTPPSPVQQFQFNRQQPTQQQLQQQHQQQQQQIQYVQRRPQKPNILPQFRPNSRISQGHPQYKQEVGSIRVQNPHFRQYPPQQALPKVGLPPINPNMRRIPPQFINRQRPHFEYLQQQQPIENANRRVFKVPQSPQQQYPINDRYLRPPPMQQPPLYYLNRPITSAMPETMQMQQRPSIIPYQDVELNKSSPPSPTLNLTSRIDNDDGSGKLEPVVTLQMLQSKKSGSKFNVLPSVPQDVPQDLSAFSHNTDDFAQNYNQFAHSQNHEQNFQYPQNHVQDFLYSQNVLPKNHKEDVNAPKEPSVYVVYPVSGQSAGPQVDAKLDELPMPSKNEYQNTPFAVVPHFEQEPLLMKKDKKKPQFPYQIEKPMPPIIEKIPLKFNSQHVHSVYNIGEEPHDAISSKLTRVTEKPIAIAYTPTEPNRISPPMSYYQHYQPQHLYDNKFSSPNLASPVISEIIDEKHHGYDYDYYHRQHEVSSSSSSSHFNNAEEVNEFHKQHYDFEAPFHASVSLNPEVTNPYQGWSIVTKPTEVNNKIDRSDLNVAESSEEVSTKKYDPNEFQPVFESGFQPIYSSNRVSTAPELKHADDESHELPSTLALSQTKSTTEIPKFSSLLSSFSEEKSSEESKTTTTTSTTTTTTKKPIVEQQQKPQSTEIDSLEALFESLTRDYDDEEESANKSENESRSL